MSDKPETVVSARFRALIVLVPALGSFLGMLAAIYLNIQWLAFVSGETGSVWVDTIAPIVMGCLMALLVLAVQKATVGKIYRIGAFPKSVDLSAQDAPWAAFAFLVAIASAAIAIFGVAPFMVAGETLLGVGPNAFMIATLIFAGLFLAPMIGYGERTQAGGDRGVSG